MADSITVEVVYALPQVQDVSSLQVPVGTTIQRAIALSGVLQRHPEVDLATARFGIYARPARVDAVLRDRDRVEIYRPLIADPKEVRRQRAAQGKAMKKGVGGRKAQSA